MTDVSNMRFTATHEWALRKGNRVVVGITDFAQARLSDVVRVELPEPDDHRCEATEEVGIVESLRSDFELHTPISGCVSAINSELLSKPEMINLSPYEDGWIMEMIPADPAEFDDLMDVDEYESNLPDED